MLRKFLDVLANMGVFIRLNDPRHEPVSEAGRAWGAVQGNLSISLQALDSDTLSVLLKNFGSSDLHVRIPGWLSFYSVSIIGQDGAPASLKSYGRSVLQDPLNTALVDRILPAGKSISTEIPIAVLYNLNPGPYKVSVSSLLPDSASPVFLSSNEIILDR